jgi:hypothetical protein
VRVATQAVEKSQAANDATHLSPDNQGPPLGFVLKESLLADIDASLARHKQVELAAVHNAFQTAEGERIKPKGVMIISPYRDQTALVDESSESTTPASMRI